VFQAFLNESDKNRILTLRKSQCMFAIIITKDFQIMGLNNSKQFNNHEYLNRSNGLVLRPLSNGPDGTDIIESRLEGP
jgi:hypothetical protein